MSVMSRLGDCVCVQGREGGGRGREVQRDIHKSTCLMYEARVLYTSAHLHTNASQINTHHSLCWHLGSRKPISRISAKRANQTGLARTTPEETITRQTP